MSNIINLIRALQASNSIDDDALDEKIAIQVASAIGHQLPVAVDQSTADAYFNAQYNTKVRKLLCEINELYIINIDQCLDIVKTTYRLRYNLVNSPSSVTDEINTLLQEKLGANIGDIFAIGSYPRIATTVESLFQITQPEVKDE